MQLKKEKPLTVFSQMHTGFKKHFKESLLLLCGKQTAEDQEQKPEVYCEAIFKIMGA